jgi:hypothetical protein
MWTPGSQQRRIESRRRIAMKVTTTRHTAEVKLLVAVVLATSVFVAAVNAQPRFQGKFTLPYEVHWSTAVLPAGQYTIRINSIGAAAFVWSADGKTAFVLPSRFRDDSQKGPTSLLITVYGNERRVRSLNLPELGASLVYEPVNKIEREMLAKSGRVTAVPVLTAGK